MNGDLHAMLAAQLDRNSDLEQLVKRLFLRLEVQQVLLNTAVHELAATVERPPGVSQQRWVNRWYSEHRMTGAYFDV